MEEIVKGFLEEVLNLDADALGEVDMDTDLTELGLDSLKAIELVVFIEDEYDIEISDDDLLIENMSTIGKIIEMIERYQ